MSPTPDNIPLPFPDEWFPEDESEDTEEEVEEEIFRVIDQYGRLDGKNKYYTTLRGAKVYLSGRYSGSNSRIQKGKVTWHELD